MLIILKCQQTLCHLFAVAHFLEEILRHDLYSSESIPTTSETDNQNAESAEQFVYDRCGDEDASREFLLEHILPYFGLRHLVVSPIGNSLTKLNTSAQLQTFPYPMVSKSFLYSNAFVAKSGAQSLSRSKA